ncbi:hypothetical protein CEXT_480631 [Caerostris extrusa]|uniref:Uncharacterized protein n=1 Tax=Caerostris extrusa TaxID=172846 RepID=A0AAV4WWG9_CAEEX|nr:hypothetical protein CEXT_480631 [Caerostris extrusa]
MLIPFDTHKAEVSVVLDKRKIAFSSRNLLYLRNRRKRCVDFGPRPGPFSLLASVCIDDVFPARERTEPRILFSLAAV